MVPELLGLGVLGYSDPLGLGVADCLLLGVLGVLGSLGPEKNISFWWGGEQTNEK